MSRGWTPPIIACALAALVWNCAGTTKAAAPLPAPVPAPAPPAPATRVTPPAAAPATRVTPPAAAPATAPASGKRSTQAGVYTDEQATEGKNIYSLQCLSCHQGDLVGDQFRKHWVGKLLSNLYGLMVETMPQDNPGSLSREDYVQVIAYLLKANGMPAGDTPLPDDSLALAKIRLDTLSTNR